MATKMLLVFLASWLVLAKSATVAPKDDEGERPPPPPSEDLAQHEITLEGLPWDLLLQKPIDDELAERDLPFLDQRESLPFSPRGRRPSCSGSHPCSRDPPRYKLEEFPPGRPTLSNIGNICAEGRKKSSYGPWNLPQTGFSHLTRQGKALNSLEEGVSQCCQLSEEEKLPCCNSVWLDVLEQFCTAEFGTKTSHYHCCKLNGADKERCFANEAPFPNYDFKGVDDQELPVKKPTACTDPTQCGAMVRFPAISFPPGEPTGTNIRNICKLRKFRPTYPASDLPESYFSWFVRQAQAVNRLENEFKKCCCKGDDVSCARKGWEKVLTQYCRQEFSVKDRRHPCCNPGPDYSCFAGKAPYPAYNKEISVVSLAEITPALLDSLCSQFMLLTKQRPIPALVQNITEPCCKLQGSERTQCAEEAKSQFIIAVCGSQRNTWEDPKKCCSQSEDAARDNCFNLNYLANVSLASAGQAVQPTVQPTEPAL